MIQWSQPVEMRWTALELFSGVGNVSAALRDAGMSVCSYDIKLGAGMNFLDSAGFLPWPQNPKHQL